MNTHVVTKPLSTSNGQIEVGDEVDASTWRNARLLEEQRYLKPIAEVKVDATTIQPDGRDKRMGRKEHNGSR